MSQGKGDMFIGEEIEEMLKRDEKSSVSMKKVFLTFHDHSLRYFGKVVLFL